MHKNKQDKRTLSLLSNLKFYCSFLTVAKSIFCHCLQKKMDNVIMAKLDSIIDRAEELINKLSENKMCLYDYNRTNEYLCQSHNIRGSEKKNDVDALKNHMSITEIPPLHTHMELEGRLGKWNAKEKYFSPGVSNLFMEQALNMLNSFDSWSKVTPWSEMQDFYYMNDSGQKMRTTIFYDDDSKEIRKCHIIKTVIHRETIVVDNHINTISSTDYPDIRLSLSVEQEIDESLVPVIVEPYHVRIKQRKSFFYTPLGFSEPIWVFDMTLTWAGDSKSSAESNQYTNTPIYEIECECLSPIAYRLHKHEKKSFVAHSLIMKLLDFFHPSTDPPSVPNANTLFESLKIAH